MKWLFGKKDVSKAAVNPADVRAAPVDPTLEAAARETSLRIRQKTEEINRLSSDILRMTDDLLGVFKGGPDEKTSK